jgi:sulfite reductase (ferredoxin)
MTPPDGLTPKFPAAPAQAKLSGVETLKQNSRFLRGAIAEEIAAEGSQVSEDSYNLLKFHGSYEQYDRDSATERKQAGQEKDYSFMVRVRMPGGRLTAAQYLALDALAEEHANGTLRLTTRQAVQFHAIVKHDLKSTIAGINETLLTTLGACGDVVRNVTTTPVPVRDAVHKRLDDDARRLSTELLPQSHAYHEIFLGEEASGAEESEPLYGSTYLPRKFKIGLATPADNTIDVFTNDLGLIAIFDGDTLLGYNIAVGGGLGMTHNRPSTFPRLGSIVGSVGPDELLAITHAVIALHRDYGDRGDRKRARLKYVVEDNGVAWTRATLGTIFGKELAPALPMPAIQVPEILGWHEQGDGRLWLGVPVASGRIADTGTFKLRTALREIVRRYGVDPIITAQQDILLSNVAPSDCAAIDALLALHGAVTAESLSPLSRWALACPALPTCGLALTEAERVRQKLVAQVEAELAKFGLEGERISLRITGCPNGCARSYAGDIGLVGRMPGFYALYVGGDFAGTRLSFKLHERVADSAVGSTLSPLLAAFARARDGSEGFGDFCHRLGAEALRDLA